MIRHTLLALVVLASVTATAFAENWPAWRGPTGMGYSTDPNPPLHWNAKENVAWKTSLPDPGNASPIVWGNRVFITQCNAKGTERGLMCIDRANGNILWHKSVPFQGTEPTHSTNPYGSATPATDGERVVVSLGSAGLVCYDFAGKELWKKDLGEFIHIWGNAASPIIHGNFVILWCGPGERQFLLALDKKTGDKVWQHDEPGGKSGDGNEWVGSWSTPIIAKVGEREELILGVPRKVKAFDPKTGKELWSCDGMGNLVYTSPVISSDGIVVAMSGFHGPALAVKAGGNGDVTKTHRLWHHSAQNPQRIGTSVILGDRCYIINEQGLASCIELKTGKDLWDKERITSATWSSMVAAAGRMYVTNMGGETLVLEPGDKPKVLAKNPLGERVLASIAIADGQIFIRGYKNLWCIGEKK